MKARKPTNTLPSWFQRVEQILATVNAIDRQEFDRASIELLFGIEKSAAALLINDLGAEKIGNRYVLPRKALLLKLHAIIKTGRAALDRETARRETLAETIQKAKEEQRLRAIPIPVKTTSRWKNLSELDGTTVEPGRITVKFETAEQALIRMMELGYAIAGDYEGFAQRVSISDVTTPQEGAA